MFSLTQQPAGPVPLAATAAVGPALSSGRGPQPPAALAASSGASARGSTYRRKRHLFIETTSAGLFEPYSGLESGWNDPKEEWVRPKRGRGDKNAVPWFLRRKKKKDHEVVSVLRLELSKLPMSVARRPVEAMDFELPYRRRDAEEAVRRKKAEQRSKRRLARRCRAVAPEWTGVAPTSPQQDNKLLTPLPITSRTVDRFDTKTVLDDPGDLPLRRRERARAFFMRVHKAFGTYLMPY
ncbi:unnamed protein product [Vitrella brassicaformis CCMP3155]|uniref:Uncharacterized protein n=1 Tax=Vitrella brassicaformis (strain CCMP3155) TaxID=1169540 RepID=A0A0G4EEC3_VITBC|nr:unnamed protein product [Vitrella brassicaformis CCMP3155]|eukprot:CEL93731.1 unnamed protein product [Vitrella brassicaformis CCMP3155]